MRTHPPGKITGRIFCLLAGVLFLLPSAVWAADVTVDCNSGGSISTALIGLSFEGPNSITVTGTCHENVVIFDRERLTIQAPFGQTATIVSPDPANNVIFILRSRGIVLRRLVVTGGSFGLLIQRSEVQVNVSTIQNNSAAGVAETQQSSLQFNKCESSTKQWRRHHCESNQQAAG